MTVIYKIFSSIHLVWVRLCSLYLYLFCICICRPRVAWSVHNLYRPCFAGIKRWQKQPPPQFTISAHTGTQSIKELFACSAVISTQISAQNTSCKCKIFAQNLLCICKKSLYYKKMEYTSKSQLAFSKIRHESTKYDNKQIQN